VEKQALTPVFSRLACQNPQLLVPLSMMDKKTGLVGRVNTTITCYNPNLFDASVHHDPPPERSYALRPCLPPFCKDKDKKDIPLGNITYMNSKFEKKRNSSLTLVIDMNVGADDAHHITEDAAMPPKKAVLLLMVLNTEVTADAKFMFVQKPEHHLLPTKYCGFYAGLVIKNGIPGLGPKSETRCTNSRNETLQLMENLAIAEPAEGSVLQWLDPTEEKQQYFKDLIFFSAVGSMGISWGVGIGNVLLAFQLFYLLSPFGLPTIPFKAESKSESPGTLRRLSSRSADTRPTYDPNIESELQVLEGRLSASGAIVTPKVSVRASQDESWKLAGVHQASKREAGSSNPLTPPKERCPFHLRAQGAVFPFFLRCSYSLLRSHLSLTPNRSHRASCTQL
jgi:hypothetical protein